MGGGTDGIGNLRTERTKMEQKDDGMKFVFEARAAAAAASVNAARAAAWAARAEQISARAAARAAELESLASASAI